MNVLRIEWAGSCPACESEALDVATENGNSDRLFVGDVVTCSECGKKGEIDCDDDFAFATWPWED